MPSVEEWCSQYSNGFPPGSLPVTARYVECQAAETF